MKSDYPIQPGLDLAYAYEAAALDLKGMLEPQKCRKGRIPDPLWKSIVSPPLQRPSR